MNTGTGIAVAGIWIGVGLVSFGAGSAVIFIGLFAMLATFFVTAGSE